MDAKKKIIGIAVAVIGVSILGGGVFMWRANFFSSGIDSGNENTDVVNTLPPAPEGYQELYKDETITAKLPEDFRKKYEEAFGETLKVLEEHPDSFIAWMDLGSIKSMFGDYKGAEEAWLYATAISKNQGRSLMNLGDLYWNKLKDYPKAEWAYRSVFEREGTSGERLPAYRDLAILYHNSYTEKHHLAVPLLRDGIEQAQLDDDKAELLALAGLWSWEDKNLDDAIYFYEEFLKIRSDNEEARKDLERIRQEKAGL